jgi:hypothetical protein
LAEAGTGNVADYRICEFTLGRQIGTMRVIACISDEEATGRPEKCSKAAILKFDRAPVLSSSFDPWWVKNYSPTAKLIFETLHPTSYG